MRIGELGNVFLYRLIKLELALLEECHKRNDRDGLGLGRNAEDVIGLTGDTVFHISPTVCFEVNHLTFVHHHGDCMRHVAAVDITLKGGIDEREPFCIESVTDIGAISQLLRGSVLSSSSACNHCRDNKQ